MVVSFFSWNRPMFNIIVLNNCSNRANRIIYAITKGKVKDRAIAAKNPKIIPTTNVKKIFFSL